MKQASRLLLAAGFLGPALVLSACSGGGSGGSVMFIQSCTLGCSNGENGSQVSCGIINTFQNQDISISFSQPVSLASLAVNNSFQVVDTVSGSLPAGTRLVDLNNPNRAIFRPRLAFDAQGNPSFGFSSTSSYQIRIPGTTQGDAGPFVTSVEGQQNQSRLLCTITTDQGLIDPVPGAPSVDILVDVVGVANPVAIDNPVACSTPGGVATANCPFPQPPGTVIPTENGRVIDAKTATQIKLIFNDLMNIGTVVLPSTGQSPFITIKTDADGDLNTTTDRDIVGGTYEFFPDQASLKTILTFTPSGGLPSAGSGANKRLIVIDVPAGVRDLAGNSVANLGVRAFAPQVIQFGEVTIPSGGEQFTTTSNLDQLRSSADWGESQLGRLKPGSGGGTGRLGDLTVPPNSTLTFYTEPQFAVGRMRVLLNPPDNRKFTVSFNNGTHLRIRRNETSEIFTGDSIADTVSNILNYVSDPAHHVAFPELAQFTFDIENGDTLIVRPVNAGVAGNGVRLNGYPEDVVQVVGGANFPVNAPNPLDTNPPAGGGLSVQYASGATAGGVDHAAFGLANPSLDPNIIPVEPRNFITNGSALQDYITITSGVFEFASIDVGLNATLRFVGRNVPRVFARGRMKVADTAQLLIAGADLGAHGSEGPQGQRGALGGPGGGNGGRGGDRPDTSTSATIPNIPNPPPAANPIDNNGVLNIGGIPDGRDGQGVGGALGYGPGATAGLGRGLGGVRWPAQFPVETNAFAGLSVLASNCDSRQLGASGSGAAYALDGDVGVARSVPDVPVGPVAFTPPDTNAGDATPIGLEPAGAPGDKRALKPSQGYLRGGAGGGGAGAHIYDTGTAGTSGACFAPLTINVYRSHSGGGGGGGGGAIQLVAGRFADFGGRIDASGGNGGSVKPNSPSQAALPYGGFAQPGGGGSGGGILIQSPVVSLSTLPNRLMIGGGAGGVGPTIAGATGVSSGGSGGPGLVRIEDNSGATTATSAAAVTTPTDPIDPTSANWLSVAPWSVQTSPIEGYSAAQSCWLVTPGNFFSLAFDSDAPNDLGWDMDLFLEQTPGNVALVGYRSGAVFAGLTPQEHWGNLIDDGTLVPPQASAPLAVRFQGARATGTLADPCNADFTPAGNATALTPWVFHPDELNAYVSVNIVRWQILFDASHPAAAMIRGVTNLRIEAHPD
ncbi:MAG: hypothetical protein FJ399_08525 [Verrucomicrobia bacterium]|nr:hypothetical protein [Verrucomicrobiota bacterium]